MTESQNCCDGKGCYTVVFTSISEQSAQHHRERATSAISPSETGYFNRDARR